MTMLGDGRGPRAGGLRRRSLGLLLLGAVAACTEVPPTSEVVEPGAAAEQPEEAGTERLDEATACERLASARADAIERVGCELEPIACPEGVRPGGGCGAYEYDAATVAACEASYESAESCTELEFEACVVSALWTGAVCIEGEGGQGGDSGVDGVGGQPPGLGGLGGAG
jgi:hypothetical protein